MIAEGNNMYTGDEYLGKNPDYHLEDAGWKAGLILGMMNKNKVFPKGIADLGCGAGGVIKQMARVMSSSVCFYGYDISPKAIDLARQSANEKNVHFQTGNYFENPRQSVDLILVIDLLEHLDNFYLFLRELKLCGSKCIFHIPLDLSGRSILKPHILKQQRESVGHIHYFSREMVWWLLEDCGFVIRDWRFTKPVSDVTNRPTVMRSIKKFLRNISFRLNPDLSSKLWGDYSVLIFAE
ncbi:MAG: class I SAM-dependent methyltransferase [Chitinophagaceae bacterium]